MKFKLIEDVNIKERILSIYDGYEQKRKKSEKKGAMGWFVHPNQGDPEAVRRFNNQVKSDSGSEADGSVGEVSSAPAGGSGE